MTNVTTLTIEQTIIIFRKHGVPMSYEKLTAIIDSGAAQQAGWAIAGSRDGQSYRVIFEKPLIAWLDSMA